MYVLITYDVNAKRTEKFKKLLRGYLDHIQNSVFSGDLPKSSLIVLRKTLSQLLQPGELVTEIASPNRNNVTITHFKKNEKEKGEAKHTISNHHKSDFRVL